MRAVLVYQCGIANVFRVESYNLADYGRDAERLTQHCFAHCEAFAQGLVEAGWGVKSAACKQAGDIAKARWTDDLDAQPFSDRFSPVDGNNTGWGSLLDAPEDN